MPIKTISPLEARRMIEAGATLIDIRSADEHARERIAAAMNVPLDRLSTAATPGDVLVFHCRSGMRTGQAVDRLAAVADGRDCYILEGGIGSWAAAGLPVERTKGAPLEIQRQVMIAAGLLVLLGSIASLIISIAWIGVAIFVGAGLTFAGLTGFCGMARLLALMPWNRQTA